MKTRRSGRFVASDRRDGRGGTGASKLPAAVGRTGVAKMTAVLILGVAVPLSAATMYLGSLSSKPAGTIAAQTMTSRAPAAPAASRNDPNDAAGWHRLAKSHLESGRFREGADAYAKVAAFVPNNPELLADYAYTLAMANGRNLNGKPTALLHAALNIDPRHQRSLALAATAAFNDREYAAAIVYWERLQKTLPTDSENASTVATRIAEARAAAAAMALAANNPLQGNVAR